ncbi:MAG TPA: GT4 family glycosyltransferase PelF [Xanthobacteraceae bacterium]|jgi:glycosyltransferase involved in cell wall biosynthesis
MRKRSARIADICLIVEGAYPYVSGGVSAWVHGLMRRQPGLEFCVVAILPEPPPPAPKYDSLPNLQALHHLYLSETSSRRRWLRPGSFDQAGFDQAVNAFLSAGGGLAELAQVERLITPLVKARRTADLLDSRLAWNLVCDLYAREMPHESFLHFFWAWRALFGGLVATMSLPLPAARVYHTVSTGYAGLLAARAAVETGRPAIITEHGVYTNERRIEILQAEWIVDTLDKGFAIHDPRRDLRDFWTTAFESYARACYEACADVITLHGGNQPAQTMQGASAARMKIIPNGVDYEALSRLPRAGPDDPPTIALVGRVVPIKDIKTYVQAVQLLRPRFPGLTALVMGPTDEQPDYYEECKATVAQLGLCGTLRFTGQVNVAQHFPRIHVNVLTSVSESQPLSVLEAGAAGIPTVATNVGACREILLGRRDEHPALGAGGIVTDVASPEQTAAAVGELLSDRGRRERLGLVMQQRIKRYYDLPVVDDAYAGIYQRHMQAPAQQVA